MHWLAFAAISVISVSFATLFQKLAMKEKESDPVVSAIVFQLLLTVFAGIYASLKGFQLPPVHTLLNFSLSALVYAGGTLTFFKAIKIIEASEMTILAGFGSIVTIAISFIFLNERLTLFQLIGGALILLAVIVVNYQRKKFALHKGIALTLLGTTLYGIGTANDAWILKSYDVASYVTIMSLLPGLILALWFPNKISQVFVSFRHINKNLLIFSLLYSIQAITFYMALEKGAMVSQMGVVSRSSIILTVILSFFLLGERRQLGKKILGAILTTIGILLIK